MEWVEDGHEKGFGRGPNNGVAIRHEDGTFGRYFHLRKGGALVRLGQVVAQGDPIGESGNVGYSLAPHLHFEVRDGFSVPVAFADVPGRGVPRMFRRYRSGAAD